MKHCCALCDKSTVTHTVWASECSVQKKMILQVKLAFEAHSSHFQVCTKSEAVNNQNKTNVRRRNSNISFTDFFTIHTTHTDNFVTVSVMRTDKTEKMNEKMLQAFFKKILLKERTYKVVKRKWGQPSVTTLNVLFLKGSQNICMTILNS